MSNDNGNFVSSGFYVGQLSTHSFIAPTYRDGQHFRASSLSLPLPYTYPAIGTEYRPAVITTTINGNFAWKYDFDSVIPALGDFNPASLIATQNVKPAFGITYERNPDVVSPADDGYYRITSITEPGSYPVFPWGRAPATGTGEATILGTTQANGYAAFSLAPRYTHQSTDATEAFKNNLLFQATVDPQTDEILGTIFGNGTYYHLSTNGFYCT